MLFYRFYAALAGLLHGNHCYFDRCSPFFSYPIIKYTKDDTGAVCDETQNLNETESETFFRYQIFSIPNPILFPIPIFFRYRYRYFFRYQNFTKPIPILFSIPKIFETDTDTFFDTKIFRNRYRYFFRYQFFSKPIPILFSIPNFFETNTDTFFDTKNFRKPIPIPSTKMEKFRNREVSKPNCHTLSPRGAFPQLTVSIWCLTVVSNVKGGFQQKYCWKQCYPDSWVSILQYKYVSKSSIVVLPLL